LKPAAYQANVEMLARYDAANGEALQRLIDGGTQLRTFSTEIMAAAEEASFAIYDEFAQTDTDFQSVFEPWKQFRSDIQQWHSLIETSYNAYIAAQYQQP